MVFQETPPPPLTMHTYLHFLCLIDPMLLGNHLGLFQFFARKHWSFSQKSLFRLKVRVNDNLNTFKTYSSKMLLEKGYVRLTFT
jgi:hypothetical protein